jgi:hypothetical protein
MLDEVRLLLVLGVASLVLLPSCTCGQLTIILLATNGYDIDWQYGHAPWYGAPYGDGSDGEYYLTCDFRYFLMLVR